MKYTKLKKRIKKNEGLSLIPYKDQLGYFTIGYGHLILKDEKFYFTKKFNKIYFENLFNKDFKKAEAECVKTFNKNIYCDNKTKELLIEMTFQMGIKSVCGFKKMLGHIKKKQKYLAALEMTKSLWYKQTPKRVENLIKHYLGL